MIAPVLQARGLTKDYGSHRALDGLDLSVGPGQIMCLLGANGAGKTTTISLFLGFIRPTAGQALVCGLEVAADPIATRRKLAYIPENVRLYPELTGVENLAYFTRLSGRPVGTDDALVAALEDAGLAPDAALRRVGTYSKGMRQKVGIAMAAARGAEALLLDEPTSGLDPKAANELMELLTRLTTQGVGVLMATHDIFRARSVGTLVGIMRRGQMVARLGPDELGSTDLEALYLDHMQESQP